MTTPNLELEKTLSTLRHMLAQRRASRKAQTDTDLRAFDTVSSEMSSQLDNPLIEQSFRAHSVLERLQALDAERQQSLFSNSSVAAQESRFSEPDAQELLAFQKALAS